MPATRSVAAELSVSGVAIEGVDAQVVVCVAVVPCGARHVAFVGILVAVAIDAGPVAEITNVGDAVDVAVGLTRIGQLVSVAIIAEIPEHSKILANQG